MRSPLPMQTTGRLSVGMGPSSEQPMAVLIGLCRTVRPSIFFGAFPLSTQTMGSPLANTEPSAVQRTGDAPGLTGEAEQPIFFGAFPLQMQKTQRPLAEQPLMMVGPSFDQQMGGTCGL